MSSKWIFESSEDNISFTIRSEYTAIYGRVRQEALIPVDKFGVRMIYPTKSLGQTWFVNMDSPTSDTLFRNLPALTKQADGSWQCSGGSSGQVRLEAWSVSGTKWQNPEITAYVKLVGGTNTSPLFQQYSRGGHHTDNDQCQGSAMKGRLYGDHVAFVKEVNHPAYCGNRGTKTLAVNLKAWNGMKTVIYNVKEAAGTFVKMELWLDLNAQDSTGKLQIKNNWIKVSEYVDRGDWSTTDADFKVDCAPLALGNTGKRQRNEILNTPGGTATANLCAWRTDGMTWNWKNLSVREITPPV